MKKWLIVLLVLVVLAGVGGVLGWNWYQDTYIVIGEQTYRRDITELDLSGTAVEKLEKLAELKELERLDLRDTGLTAEEYEYLRQALPDCRILWSVPFQDGYCSEEITELTVTSLEMQDLDRLAYLKNLNTVHAEQCRDYESLMALKRTRPELDIFYHVSVGGTEYRENTTELILGNADPQEVGAALAYLPELKKVTFTGTAPENEQIYEWKCQYPEVTFVWSFDVCGVSATSLDTELYLNEIPMESIEEVQTALRYFYNLEWVEMCDCGIPSEEMDILSKQYPGTRFVWTIRMGNCVLRTDATTFMPYHFGYGKYNKLYDEDCADLKYCVDMVCLDMGHMGITDYSFLNCMPKLQYLIIADTPGTDFSPIKNCKELVFLEVFWTEFSDTELLTGLTKLEDLNLGYTQVRNVEPLLKMTWLHRLWFPGTGLPEETRQVLMENLPDTKMIFHLCGATDNGWRQSPNYYAMRDLLGMPYLE